MCLSDCKVIILRKVVTRVKVHWRCVWSCPKLNNLHNLSPVHSRQSPSEPSDTGASGEREARGRLAWHQACITLVFPHQKIFENCGIKRLNRVGKSSENWTQICYFPPLKCLWLMPLKHNETSLCTLLSSSFHWIFVCLISIETTKPWNAPEIG